MNGKRMKPESHTSFVRIFLVHIVKKEVRKERTVYICLGYSAVPFSHSCQGPTLSL